MTETKNRDLALAGEIALGAYLIGSGLVLLVRAISREQALEQAELVESRVDDRLRLHVERFEHVEIPPRPPGTEEPTAARSSSSSRSRSSNKDKGKGKG